MDQTGHGKWLEAGRGGQGTADQERVRGGGEVELSVPAVFSSSSPRHEERSASGLIPGNVQGVGEKTIATILADQVDLPQVNVLLKVHFILEFHLFDQSLHPHLQTAILLRQTPIEVGIDLKIHHIL
jgi:hypothetical protein